MNKGVMKIEQYNIKCNIRRMSVKGIATSFIDKEWVDGGDDSGYYRELEIPLSVHKVIIDFEADVDVDLVVNTVYSDRLNLFVAIAKRTIRNLDAHVDTFEIPAFLYPLYSSYAG